MTLLVTDLHGIGMLGPGLPDWPSARAILAGAVPYRMQATEIPATALLPPAERRRVGRTVRTALVVGSEAIGTTTMAAASLKSVFTSSGGDGVNCDEICRVLASSDRQISPTRFHNSVHNAPAGYWSIAHNATAASTSLGGFDGSFSVGLIAAMSQVVVDQCPVLLIAYDTDYPEPLRAKRPIPDAFGVALLLTPSGSTASLGRLAINFSDCAADRLDEPQLEELRVSIPAARSLPLLRRLARGESGRVTLEYLSPLQLAVEVSSGP
jgi:hypothetical protein